MVIDDQYVEFRKALAEGKVVQIAGLNPTAHPTIYKNSYVDMEGGLFDKAIELYRIKSEETIWRSKINKYNIWSPLTFI